MAWVGLASYYQRKIMIIIIIIIIIMFKKYILAQLEDLDLIQQPVYKMSWSVLDRRGG